MGIFSAPPLKGAFWTRPNGNAKRQLSTAANSLGCVLIRETLAEHWSACSRRPLSFRSARSIVLLVVRGQETKVPIRRLKQASDFARLECVAVLHFMVVSGSEAARAVAAELESYLIDRAESLPQLSNSERHASDEAAFDFVRRLEQLGCAVCVGVDQADLRFDDDPSKTRAYDLGCLVVSKIEDEAAFVSVKGG
jgi:hypothetical protein